MGTTRPLRESDIRQLVDLSRRLFPGSQTLSADEQAERFRALCLENPWVDDTIPSLVYEEPDGLIAGSVAVVPRAMKLNGQPIRAAVSQHLMVDPAARSKLIAFDLLRTFLRGPQDLSVADMANDVSRGMWERLGGHTSNCHSLYWRRVVQPCSSLIQRRSGLMATCAMPFAHTLDTLMSRIPWSPFNVVRPETTGEPAGADQLLAKIDQAASEFSLRPEYDHDSLAWLLDRLRLETRYGSLECVIVNDPDGKPLGWFIGYFRKGGRCQVLQLCSPGGSLRAVLEHAAHRAVKAGAREIGGRIDMRRVREYRDARCEIIPGAHWMLVHSSRQDVLDAIHRDDAFLTRLEGDLWLL